MTRQPLPIDEVIPALRAALRAGGRAVLQAPPGAGKTTAVPLALVDEPWAVGQKIVMLEPRRLAARAAARRMSFMAGQPLGGLVGFRVRGETRVSATTRIEVVTEGVLTRMLITDPTLDGVAAVIFDEFHERSVIADTGLALTLRTAELLRPELRLVVMSATLDGEHVGTLLGSAPVITAQGRAFPVSTQWIPQRAGGRPLEGIPAAVQRALDETDGDVLVFLPGAGEIKRIADRIAGLCSERNTRLFALHGTMPEEEQDAAISASAPGTRKVVLATSIAETSLTIEGVRAVVDSGLARVPRMDLRSGMTRLETVRITQDSAEQRRGRAGRVAPGACYRLWSEAEHLALMAHRTPEILSADLAPLALDLAVAGVEDVTTLAWLDAPPPSALSQARGLLTELDALDDRGTITPHGARMANMGLHPRLAHLVLRGRELGHTRLACEIAALLGERDVLIKREMDVDPDLAIRIAAVRRESGGDWSVVDRGRVMRVREEARRISERVSEAFREVRGGQAARAPADDDVAYAGELLALAYPDRVALARTGGRGSFRMRNGRGAQLSEVSPLAREGAIAIADTDGARDDARVFLAAALDRAALDTLFANQITESSEVAFDDTSGAMTQTVRRMLGALVLAERVTKVRDAALIVPAILSRVRRDGIAAIAWNDAAARMRERLTFLHTIGPDWPAMDDAALLDSLDEWFAPALEGVHRLGDIAKADLAHALLSRVPPKRRGSLDALAPTHIEVATGSRIPVDYADPAAPLIAVRMQELFGTPETPRIGGGKVAVTLHLLSPAGRPLQVTRDLGGFWRGSYAEVRKEMRGRYPRHPWPENPLEAEATRRVKPRGR